MKVAVVLHVLAAATLVQDIILLPSQLMYVLFAKILDQESVVMAEQGVTKQTKILARDGSRENVLCFVRGGYNFCKTDGRRAASVTLNHESTKFVTNGQCAKRSSGTAMKHETT